MLTKIIYASEAKSPFSTEQLVELLEIARSRNFENDVTGMLLYANQSFLQLLEGEQQAVGEIFDSIVEDPRHHKIKVMAHEKTEERRFPDWSMGFESLNKAELKKNIQGYHSSDEFPLVSPRLIPSAGIAETLLRRFSRA